MSDEGRWEGPFEIENDAGYCCQSCGKNATHAINLHLPETDEYRQHDVLAFLLCVEHARAVENKEVVRVVG